MGLVRHRQAYGSAYGPEPTWLYVCDPTARAASTSSVAVANRAVYIRRSTPAVPISKVLVSVGVQSGNICVAAYDHDVVNNRPGNRLATSGSVACPAPGEQSVSLGATVTPEWLCITVDNITATFSIASSAPSIVANAGRGRTAYQSSAFPAPNPAAPAGFLMGGLFILVGQP
jgi:hypothetical protein